MSNIIIGKHTLESLTTGMYADPYVVFREYIQNAADAIDNAVRQSLLTSDSAKIVIHLSPAEKSIIISDNGTGIRADEAEQTLISIGNSKKTSEFDRGFRGIGRLAALGYCSKLTFETSAMSETTGTKIVIDSRKLSLLLTSKENKDVTISEVLEQVYLVEQYPENSASHYFRVILDGVEDTSGLNDYENVVSYISQNAPVPYDPNSFVWGEEIIRRLHAEGLEIDSYNILLSFGNTVKQIYKPYKDRFLVDKGKNLYDSVSDIKLVKIKQNDGDIITENDWGRKELAYKIAGETHAVYRVYELSLPAEAPAKIDGVLNITEGVIRHLIVKIDDKIEAALAEEKKARAAREAARAEREKAE